MLCWIIKEVFPLPIFIRFAILIFMLLKCFVLLPPPFISKKYMKLKAKSKSNYKISLIKNYSIKSENQKTRFSTNCIYVENHKVQKLLYWQCLSPPLTLESLNEDIEGHWWFRLTSQSSMFPYFLFSWRAIKLSMKSILKTNSVNTKKIDFTKTYDMPNKKARSKNCRIKWPRNN